MTVPMPITRPHVTIKNCADINSIGGMIGSYCYQQAYLYKATGYDSRNRVVFTEEPLLINCYYNQIPVTINSVDGNTTLCSGKIYCPLSVKINMPNDYLVFEGRRLEIVKVVLAQSFSQNHYEVYVK